MKKLVIVESPAKAKTIGKIIGNDYVVKASVGHVRDLPDHSLGIKISENDTRFDPVYVIADNKKGVVSDLKNSARGCDEILLASDPDREGEAIAWHLREILDDSNGEAGGKKFRRVLYNEITPAAVHRAFENPGEIDQHLVDAQQARRVLDRLVGFKVSASLWKQVGKGLSAGRVQSVGLRLVCEREAEIQSFDPQSYWIFGAKLAKRVDPKAPFEVRLRQINGEKADVGDEKLAAQVEVALKSGEYTVSDVSTSKKTRRPYAPFITSTLQQAASATLGYAPSVTMSLAQSLYEGVDIGGEGQVGLITYMRTDSFTISKDASDAAGKFIVDKYGKEYHQAKPRTFKNKRSAQGAHEAIRPTDPARTPESLAHKLKPQALKLYDLIWRRFMASQMSDAVSDVTTAKITTTPPHPADSLIRELTLSASSSELIFPGFMKVFGNVRQTSEDDSKEGDDDTIESLPPLEPGEELDRISVSAERKETKPPSRYNEASLVKALEANGIGRPSTYAAIIATLLARKYVVKEKRNLVPTELGQSVNAFLVEKYNDLFNVEFTAQMENKLDEVEDPDKLLDWQGMLASFYKQLKGWLADAKAPDADPDIVLAVLEKFKEIKEWSPPTKRGKRVFSDEDFVKDIEATFLGKPTSKSPFRKRKPKKGEPVVDADGDTAAREAFPPDPDAATTGAITENQLNALLRILARYRTQIEGFEDFFKSIGQEKTLDDENLQPPRESTLAIFETIDKVGPPEGSESFYTSLRDQVKRGKRLSPKQRHYLERMFLESHERIEGFSPELCKKLEVEYELPTPFDNGKAEEILAGLANVKDWKAPSKKGRRTFDDADFFRSVTTQFSVKKRLSGAQMKVLDRMLMNYKEQIPDSEAIIAKYDIKALERRPGRTRKNPEVES